MFGRIFPRQIDNAYRGHALAVWLLAATVLGKFIMGANVAGLNPWLSNRFVITDADHIAIDTFGAEAASSVMFSFASWGLALLVLSLLGGVVLIRYRAMIPLMFLLLSIEHFGRWEISRLNPIVRTIKGQGFSSGVLSINYAFMAMLAAGLALSLLNRSAIVKPT